MHTIVKVLKVIRIPIINDITYAVQYTEIPMATMIVTIKDLLLF